MGNQMIGNNLRQVRGRINTACKSVGKNLEEVSLLLATKTVSPENINQVIDLGETLIGESKAQELQSKYPDIKTENIETHFIGHLQTNKVNNVLRYATYIHSVDRLRLASALHKRAERVGKKLDILIQVNTSYEISKFGVAPEETLHLIEQVSQLDSLNIKGLMTIGKLSANPEEARVYFRRLKSIQEQVKAQNYTGVKMNVLSMGMSRDYEVAIEEGATMVRIGTAIFGERIYPDSYYWDEQTNIDE